jgi:TIR domain
MKVFLSLSTKDKQFVQALAAELEAENIQSWVCEFGGNFVARIEEGLRDAGLISCFGRLRGRILGLDASRMDFG